MRDENLTEATGGAKRTSGIEAGACVVVVLREPREKCWGVLERIDAAGVFVRGLDLNAFEDWVRAVAHDEPFLGVSDQFFPMWRVERIARDESVGEIASLAEQAERRTGKSIAELL